MEYKKIMLTEEENIATIVFNNPKALNALSIEVLEEFSDALYKVEKNSEIKVLILTGVGEKAFIAGADIKQLAELDSLGAKMFAEKGQFAIDKICALPIPVIAAVNGFALGGGTEMALAADFIYACESAKFGLPEITLGLIPGFGGTQRLARLIGKNMAKELIFTGKMISAKEAAGLGLVNKVIPDAKLMIETMNTAKAIAEKGRVSLYAAKEAINYGSETDLQTGCKFEISAFALCMASEDAKEGTSAFLEKRKPVFTGKLEKALGTK